MSNVAFSSSAANVAKRGLVRLGKGPSASSRAFVNWMIEDAFPLWLKKGWDAKRGGFHERLFFDGTPDSLVERRTRVQFRQIYVFAHASLLGWTDGLKLAFQGLEHVIQRAWGPDGAPGFVHLLAPDGAVVDARRDSYDHAFAILALAWLARASGDAQVRALLELVLGFVDSRLTDADGFLLEAIPPQLPRRQNPHMHMLEASLAMMEALGHPESGLRAARYRKMLERTFLDPETSLLVEFFNEDWSPVRFNGAVAIEPGHMAEWVWLIRRYERLTGQKASPMGTHFLGAALRGQGADGFLCDEMNSHGRILTSTRRLWPQTEMIKGWLAQAESGADRADEAAEQMIDMLMANYLGKPFAGGWIDKFTAQGEPATDTVPASTLYHIFMAASEAERLLGR